MCEECRRKSKQVLSAAREFGEQQDCDGLALVMRAWRCWAIVRVSLGICVTDRRKCSVQLAMPEVGEHFQPLLGTINARSRH